MRAGRILPRGRLPTVSMEPQRRRRCRAASYAEPARLGSWLGSWLEGWRWLGLEGWRLGSVAAWRRWGHAGMGSRALGSLPVPGRGLAVEWERPHARQDVQRRPGNAQSSSHYRPKAKHGDRATHARSLCRGSRAQSAAGGIFCSAVPSPQGVDHDPWMERRIPSELSPCATRGTHEVLARATAYKWPHLVL